MKHLAIIPARSRSKGLVHKNIKLLAGKPLLAHAIEAALASNLFDEVFVSTDSEEYAQIARTFGASVPFFRSEALSCDTSSSWDMVRETLANYAALGYDFERFALLQPTSPLRTSEDIVAAFHQMDNQQASAIIGVCEVDHSPLWSNVLPSDHSLVNFLPEKIRNTPRQELQTFYRVNGALYLVDTKYFLSMKDIYQEKCFAFVMEKNHSVDIDDALDFIIAEAMLSVKQ